MIILVVASVALAQVAGLSSVKWGGGVLFGAKLLDDQLTLKRNDRERRINVNSELRKEDDWVIVTLPADELPDAVKKLAGEHWLTLQERESFLLSLDHFLASGSSSYDFDDHMRVQDERKKDQVLRSALSKSP